MTAPLDDRFDLGDGLSVRRLGFGAMQLTGPGVWGPAPDHDNAVAVLRRAVELGVELIDTSDAYGPHTNEELIREALHPYPDNVVIATKGGFVRTGPNQWIPVGRPAYLRQCVELSLRRLGVERIDLYQLHRIDPDVAIADQVGVLAEMQREGKIRHIGLSEISVKELKKAAKAAPIASVQNRYNLAGRKSEDVLTACARDGIAFIPWHPLAQGKLSGDRRLATIAAKHGATEGQIALAWLLQRSPVMLPIPGTSSIAHLEENLGAADVHLDPDDVAELDRLA